MADDDDVDPTDADAPPPRVGAAIEPASLTSPSKPRFQPKAVNIGGESIADRLLPHLKQIMLMAGVVALILLVVFGRRWWIERGQVAETDKLADVLAVGRKPVRVPDPATLGSGAGSGAGSGSAVAPAPDTGSDYADTTARANAVLTAVAQQGTAPPGVYYATALADAGKLDEAIAEYAKHETDKGLEGVLAHEGKGLAYEAKAAAEKDATASQKDYEAALAAFAAEQPDETGPRYAYAQYHQGRMLQLLGKTADAKAALTRAKDAAKDSPDVLPLLIDRRLASLGA